MKRVIQILSLTDSHEDAQQMYIAQQKQDGFLGGRILLPSEINPRFRVQTFHDDCDKDALMNDWLPDGMRRVFISESLVRKCLITSGGSGGRRVNLERRD